MPLSAAAKASSFFLAASLIAAAALAAAPAPAPAPAPAVDCITPLANMSDCLSYVTVGSNDTVPDKHCCPELAGLVESNPTCLCQLLSNPEKTTGFDIDIKRALKLPSACNVQTPPISLCALLGFPVAGAPEGAPEGAPGSAPSPSGVPAPDAGVSPTTPTDPGSYGSKTECFHLGLLLGLVMAFLLPILL